MQTPCAPRRGELLSQTIALPHATRVQPQLTPPAPLTQLHQSQPFCPTRPRKPTAQRAVRQALLEAALPTHTRPAHPSPAAVLGKKITVAATVSTGRARGTQPRLVMRRAGFRQAVGAADLRLVRPACSKPCFGRAWVAAGEWARTLPTPATLSLPRPARCLSTRVRS